MFFYIDGARLSVYIASNFFPLLAYSELGTVALVASFFFHLRTRDIFYSSSAPFLFTPFFFPFSVCRIAIKPLL